MLESLRDAGNERLRELEVKDIKTFYYHDNECHMAKLSILTDLEVKMWFWLGLFTVFLVWCVI